MSFGDAVSIWDGVRERVLALRGTDVHGASGHRFELADPLTPEQVAEVEAQYGVRLPEEYRSFLLEVAAGGAGPGYFVFLLVRDEGRWGWRYSKDSLGTPDLTGAFGDARDGDELDPGYDARELKREDFDSDETHRAAWKAWDDEWEELIEARVAGSVLIQYGGCTDHSRLVVSGPHGGRDLGRVGELHVESPVPRLRHLVPGLAGAHRERVRRIVPNKCSHIDVHHLPIR